MILLVTVAGFQGNISGLTTVNDNASLFGVQVGGAGHGLNTALTNININNYAGPTAGAPPVISAIIAAAAGSAANTIKVGITGPLGSAADLSAGQILVSNDGPAGTAASPDLSYGTWDITANSTSFLQLDQGGVGGATALTLAGAGTIGLGQDAAGHWQLLKSIDASGTTGAVDITGATSVVGGTNSAASGTNPDGLFGSAAGLLNEGTGFGGGSFALNLVKLGTGLTWLDASAANATEIAALTTTGVVVAGNEIVVANSVVNAATTTATFGGIAGFDTLGIAFGAGATTLNEANLPTSFTTLRYESAATGALTVNKGVDGLTVDFHGNDPGSFDATTINAAVVATATLTLDFGNKALGTEDATGLITTTGYTTVDINTTGDGVTTHPDSAGGITLSASDISGTANAVTVNIAGTQAFTTGFVTDAGGGSGILLPTSATDVINVTSAIGVDLGTTNFGIIKAAPSTGLIVADTYHNSNITGSATAPNTITGGDGGGLPGTGNTITGGSGSDTITTGLGANTINLGATHGTDSVTIGSGFGGVIETAGNVVHQGSWGLAFGATPTFVADPVSVPTTASLFGNALHGGTSASQTVINNFSVATGSTDSLHFQASDWTQANTANNIGGSDIGLVTVGISAFVHAGDAVSINSVTTSGQAFTAPGNNLIEIGGANTFANASTLANALQTSFDLKTGGLSNLNDMHLLVAYSDGANIHIADVALYNTSGGATTNSIADHVYASDMVQLTGVNNFAALNGHLGHFA